PSDDEVVEAFAARTRSEFDASEQNIPEQREIAEQAEPRIPERRRTILFEHEVPDPSESVAGNGRGQQPPRVCAGKRNGHDQNDQGRSDEVQASTRRVAMLGQIEGVEISEALEAIVGRGRRWLIHSGALGLENERRASFLSRIKGLKRMIQSHPA